MEDVFVYLIQDRYDKTYHKGSNRWTVDLVKAKKYPNEGFAKNALAYHKQLYARQNYVIQRFKLVEV